VRRLNEVNYYKHMNYKDMIKGVGPVILGVAIVVVIISMLAQRQAEAPVVVVDPQSQAQLRLSEKGTAGGLTILPITLMEDSRCPADVQCIQAGTIKVQVQIISAMGPSVMVMELNKPVTTEAEEVTLTQVTPAPKAGVNVNKADYVFSFEVKKRALTEINP
jgi:hypothetical protein